MLHLQQQARSCGQRQPLRSHALASQGCPALRSPCPVSPAPQQSSGEPLKACQYFGQASKVMVKVKACFIIHTPGPGVSTCGHHLTPCQAQQAVMCRGVRGNSVVADLQPQDEPCALGCHLMAPPHQALTQLAEHCGFSRGSPPCLLLQCQHRPSEHHSSLRHPLRRSPSDLTLSW